MDAERVARLHSTSGGSSETELNELAVMPINWPESVRVVMTVTPVANWPSAARNAVGSKFGVLARVIGQVGGRIGLVAPDRPSVVLRVVLESDEPFLKPCKSWRFDSILAESAACSRHKPARAMWATP